MTLKTTLSSQPAAFTRAMRAVMAAQWRPELTIQEIPAPQRIAPHAVAIAADVEAHGEEVGDGRLILLHDPLGNPAWGGTFRCVTYAKADVDPDMVTDPLLADVGWSWLLEALAEHGVNHRAAAGTVTAVSSKSFGDMSDEPGRAEVEIRASWTPVLEPNGAGLEGHLAAWGELLCMTAGLPPLPAGVAVLPSARSRRR